MRPKAERQARGLPGGNIVALSDDPSVSRNRRVLWPWFAIVPTLIVLAAEGRYQRGAYTARLVDRIECSQQARRPNATIHTGGGMI